MVNKSTEIIKKDVVNPLGPIFTKWPRTINYIEDKMIAEISKEKKN